MATDVNGSSPIPGERAAQHHQHHHHQHAANGDGTATPAALPAPAATTTLPAPPPARADLPTLDIVPPVHMHLDGTALPLMSLPVLPIGVVRAHHISHAYLTPMQQMFQDEAAGSDPPPAMSSMHPIDLQKMGAPSLDEQERREMEQAKAHAQIEARLAEEAVDEEDAGKGDSRGMKIALSLTAVLAVCFCVGGSVVLSWNTPALKTEFHCNELYVWGLLFVIFEGIYLLGILMQLCCSGESIHTKRSKTAILLVLFLMSVLFFVWGTVIINTSECPEAEYQSLWNYFRILYWFIVGVWVSVLIILTLPVILFFVFKTLMARREK